MPNYYQSSGRRQGAAAHVFIAVPTYGDLKPGFVHSLIQGQQNLFARKVSVDVAILAGNCHVDDARNDLCRMFVESSATHLMFIDADVQFPHDAIGRLLDADKDIVAGVYPFKGDDENYPVVVLDPAWAGGLIEVTAVPGGFLLIRREVILDMYNTEAERHGAWIDKGQHGTLPIAEIFHRITTQARDGSFKRPSGDQVFCLKARERGYAIWVDPDISFGHTGDKTWVGNLANWWWRNSGEVEPQAAEALKRGDLRTFAGLFGNAPYACDAQMLAMLADLAKGQRVLETGSGASTCVMLAAGAEVVALESEPLWGQKTTRFLEAAGLPVAAVAYRPIHDGEHGRWYAREALPEADLVFIDGPRREEAGMRARICDYAPDVIRNASVLVVDDTDDADGRLLVARLHQEFGFTFDTYKGPRREYAVGRKHAAETDQPDTDAGSEAGGAAGAEARAA